jgi:acetyl coenzyme A synthetase (ADP forming)-like protein
MFFEPKVVAVVGASHTPGKLGYEIFKNMLRSGFKGKVCPVNPEGGKILGHETYTTVFEIPENVDMAIIATSAPIVPRLVQNCAEKGAKAVVITSGGFGEIGANGRKLESKISKIARDAGVRVIGPNCVGVFDAKTKVDTIFDPPSRLKRPTLGSIAVISQSATIGAGLMDWMAQQGIGISKFVNYGNKCDVGETELLEYLLDDPNTKVIAMHVEGVEDGRRFLEVARCVTRFKPIVVMKTGRTESGARATLSHSAAIAGADIIYGTAFKQAGMIRVMTVEEMLDVAKALAYQETPKGRRVAVVGNSGGAAIIVADACEELGLRLTELSEKTIKSLRETFPLHYIIRNPMDLTGDVTSAKIGLALEAVFSDENVDAIVLLIQWQVPLLEPSVIDVIGRIAGNHKEKPTLLSAIGGTHSAKVSASLEKKYRIPTYPIPERAVRALHALFERGEFLRKIGEKEPWRNASS